jgi:hypothetical protein
MLPQRVGTGSWSANETTSTSLQVMRTELIGAGHTSAAAKPRTHVVCTIAEHHYFKGVAALANSLVRSGFEGTLVVGYRGERPSWLHALGRLPTTDTYAITPRVHLELVEIAGTWHLNNCKPHFLEQLLFRKHSQADLVYYFDTDIVITHPWADFARWAHSGVVLVHDSADAFMSPHHVYRRAWQALAAKCDRSCREFTGYVNGGCIGVNRIHADFVKVWCSLMEELERDGADMRKMKNTTGKLEFSRMDQDILNATIMATDTPIALLGYEAMGLFPWVGEVMPHAMWQKKPWKRNYVIDALRGLPPDRTHIAYWKFVDGPIRPFNDFELRVKRVQVAIGRFIGLLHRRSYRDS